MTPVFAHGALRLYLLGLLAESSMHGYEVMRALERRFGGTYQPSAGTIYPRLARLEEEGLVVKHAEGRRSRYEITDAGRAELAARQGELDAVEAEVADSVRRLADEVRGGVREAMRTLRADLAAAERDARTTAPTDDDRDAGDDADRASWSTPHARSEPYDAERAALRAEVQEVDLAVARLRSGVRSLVRAPRVSLPEVRAARDEVDAAVARIRSLLGR